MQTTYRFRTAVPVDLDDILAFVSPRQASETTALVWSGQYMVAVAGQRPVAGVGWTDARQRATGSLGLADMFVHPAHRGRGLARKLVDLVSGALN